MQGVRLLNIRHALLIPICFTAWGEQPNPTKADWGMQGDTVLGRKTYITLKLITYELGEVTDSTWKSPKLSPAPHSHCLEGKDALRSVVTTTETLCNVFI